MQIQIRVQGEKPELVKKAAESGLTAKLVKNATIIDLKVKQPISYSRFAFSEEELHELNRVLEPYLDSLRNYQTTLYKEAFDLLEWKNEMLHLFETMIKETTQSTERKRIPTKPSESVLNNLALETAKQKVGNPTQQYIVWHDEKGQKHLIQNPEYTELLKFAQEEKLKLEQFYTASKVETAPHDRRLQLAKLCETIVGTIVKRACRMYQGLGDYYFAYPQDFTVFKEMEKQSDEQTLDAFLRPRKVGALLGNVDFFYEKGLDNKGQNIYRMKFRDSNGRKIDLAEYWKKSKALVSVSPITYDETHLFKALGLKLFERENFQLFLQEQITNIFLKLVNQIYTLLQEGILNQELVQDTFKKIKALIEPFVEDPTYFFNQAFLPTQLNNDNIVLAAYGCIYISMVRRSSNFYAERAQWSPKENDGQKQSKDGISGWFSTNAADLNLRNNDAGFFHNFTPEEIDVLKQKKVLEINVESGTPPDFIEYEFSARSEIPSHSAPIDTAVSTSSTIGIHLRTISDLAIGDTEKTISLPSISGSRFVGVVFEDTSETPRLADMQALSWDQTGWTITPPQLDAVQSIKIFYSAIEKAKEVEPTFNTREYQREIQNLTSEMEQYGFTFLAIELKKILREKTFTFSMVVDAVKNTSCYSYSGNSGYFDKNRPPECLSNFIIPNIGILATQCRGANEVAAVCIAKIFKGKKDISVGVSLGYSVPTSPDTTVQISQANAHARLKIFFQNTVFHLDATPLKNIRSLNFASLNSQLETLVPAQQLNQIYSNFVNDLHSINPQFSDREIAQSLDLLNTDHSAPLPQLLQIYTQLRDGELSGIYALNALKRIEKKIDGLALHSHPELENSIYNFRKNLSLYVAMKKFVQNLRLVVQ